MLGPHTPSSMLLQAVRKYGESVCIGRMALTYYHNPAAAVGGGMPGCGSARSIPSPLMGMRRGADWMLHLPDNMPTQAAQPCLMGTPVVAANSAPPHQGTDQSPLGVGPCSRAPLRLACPAPPQGWTLQPPRHPSGEVILSRGGPAIPVGRVILFRGAPPSQWGGHFVLCPKTTRR